MTAITSLESIHKKGIFGDHHKKEEKDLLRISEIKDLAIIQVVQYKKSNIKLESVKIKNLKFPSENLQVSSNSETRILWNAPRTWLIISRDRNIIKTIKKNCDEKNFAVTDISHSRAIIQIKGSQASEVLKKGSPINFNELKVNECAGTVYHGISIIVDSISGNPDTYNLLTLRSFGESFYHHITDSALEFGYVGI
tara:strand:- start:324 stop:911 length:588 start_codon:yes stop_codon:yes gene_type:complete